MNIFESYLKDIVGLIKKNQQKLDLTETNNFKGANLEIPPPNIGSDLSSNICMILAKSNKLDPNKLAIKIKELIKKNINDFKIIEIAKPGFLNFYLSNDALLNIINNILLEKNKFGSLKNKKTYNIEFVSANPTGPMHIGHCRGAVFGDVLSNLLKFNVNKVTKEYYINYYGSQIKNFVKSVYLRIREIKFKEKFPNEKDLYPGEYIKDIAKKILVKSKLKFDSFEDSYNSLEKESHYTIQ